MCNLLCLVIVGGNESYEPAEKRLSQQQNDLRIALGLSDQLMQAMPITASCNEVAAINITVLYWLFRLI